MIGSSHFERELDEIEFLNSCSSGSNFKNQHPNSAKGNNNSNENDIRSSAGDGNLTSNEGYGCNLVFLTGEKHDSYKDG